MSKIPFNDSFRDRLGDKVDLIYDKKGSFVAQFGGGMFIFLLVIGIIAYFVYDKNVDNVVGVIGLVLIEICILMVSSIPFVGIIFIVMNKLFWFESLMSILELEASIITSTVDIAFLIIGTVMFVLWTMFAIRAVILKKIIEFGLVGLIAKGVQDWSNKKGK